jgi:hypothetical protein
VKCGSKQTDFPDNQARPVGFLVRVICVSGVLAPQTLPDGRPNHLGYFQINNQNLSGWDNIQWLPVLRTGDSG